MVWIRVSVTRGVTPNQHLGMCFCVQFYRIWREDAVHSNGGVQLWWCWICNWFSWFFGIGQVAVLRPTRAAVNADAQLCFLHMRGRTTPAARIKQCEEAPHASQILSRALIFAHPGPWSLIYCCGSHTLSYFCSDLRRLAKLCYSIL
jgi:hypothetical protein